MFCCNCIPLNAHGSRGEIILGTFCASVMLILREILAGYVDLAFIDLGDVCGQNAESGHAKIICRLPIRPPHPSDMDVFAGTA